MTGVKFIVQKNAIRIRLPRKVAKHCYHIGACDNDIKFYVNKFKKLFENLPIELIKSVLRPYGAWDKNELNDIEQNYHRLLWLASAMVQEMKSCWITMETY